MKLDELSREDIYELISELFDREDFRNIYDLHMEKNDTELHFIVELKWEENEWVSFECWLDDAGICSEDVSFSDAAYEISIEFLIAKGCYYLQTDNRFLKRR